eukprot:3510674-Pyramimonas_sp.AAC.2
MPGLGNDRVVFGWSSRSSSNRSCKLALRPSFEAVVVVVVVVGGGGRHRRWRRRWNRWRRKRTG